MKKIFVQIITISLVLFMLLQMVSCTNKNQEESSDTTTAQQEDDASTTIVGNDVLELPDGLNYDDKEIKFLTRSEYKGEFMPDESKTDAYSQSLYLRNEQVMDELGVILTFVDLACDEFVGYFSDSPYFNKVQVEMESGSTEFQVFASFAYFTPAFVRNGYFADVNQIENSYIHLEKIWWNQDYNQQSSINGKNFMLMGDICTTSMEECEVLFYNETLLNDYLKMTTSDLVNKVYAHEWTYEYFLDCLTAFGSSASTGVWGAALQDNSYSIDGFMTGLGLSLVTKDDNSDAPKINVTDQHNFDIAEALTKLYHSNEAVLSVGVDCAPAFSSGQALFYGSIMKSAEQMHTGTVSYGMIPYPLWDESQEDYYPVSHDAYTVLGISNYTENKDAVTAVLELMAYKSYVSVRPALYTTNFEYKYFSSPEKAEMFNFIVDRMSYNFGYIYSDVIKVADDSWGLTHFFRYSIAGNRTDLSSSLYSRLSTFKLNLKELVNSDNMK